MIISIIGYMGAGKSAVGKSLAKLLGFSFIDLDDYIIEREKKSIQQIFRENGEIYFRNKEKEYLEELLKKDNLVLSLGGGTPVYYNNIDVINGNSVSIYLRMKPSELAERLVTEKSHRPIIAHLNDEEIGEFIAKHLFERAPYYEKAKFKIDANKSVEELCQDIISRIS